MIATCLFQRGGTNIKTFDRPDVLVKNGLFQYSRNPMYLGFTIAMLGIAVLFGSVSAFAVGVFWIVITRCWYIAAEEKMMLEKFGGEYLVYKETVRRWL